MSDLTALVGALDEEGLDALLDAMDDADREVDDPVDEAVPLEPEARRQWAKQSLIHFMRTYLPHYAKKPFARFHHDLAGTALDVTLCRGDYEHHQGFVAAAPRGHGKSAFVSLALPLYCICFQLKRFIIIYSDTDEQAKTIIGNIRIELEGNERLRRDFGALDGDAHGLPWGARDFVAAHADAQGRVRFHTRVLGRGLLAKGRGLRQQDARPDLIVLDDMENDEHVREASQRDKVWGIITRAILPMLDPNVGRVLMVGTILHQASALRRMLNQTMLPNAEFIGGFWKAIADDGAILWPEEYPYERLMGRKATMGPFAFSSEYQNDPIDEEARVVRPEWLRWFTSDDISYDPETRQWAHRGDPLRIFMMVDPAISAREEADECAIVIGGVPRDRSRVLVLAVYAGRIDFNAQVIAACQFSEFYKIRRGGIEAVAYQQALQQETRRRLGKGHIWPVKRSRSKKYERLKGTAPVFAQGMVYLRAAREGEQGELEELRLRVVHHTQVALYRQIIYYPRADHDDLFDALEGVLRLAAVHPALLLPARA